VKRNEVETEVSFEPFNDTEVNRERGEWQHEVYLLTFPYWKRSVLEHVWKEMPCYYSFVCQLRRLCSM